MKILIAEDDEAIMTSYKMVLKQRKHEVFATSDGEQCLMIFKEHNGQMARKGQQAKPRPGSQTSNTPFDLVILDYRMPKKNGIEVAESILSAVPGQRIIIASAYTHEIPESKFSGKSSVGMLQKPFEFDVFLNLVEGGPAGSAGKGGVRKQPSDISMPLADFSNNGLDDQFTTKMGDMSGIFWRED